MKIEILIGQDDPIIFPLNKNKVVIGAGDNCDVILPSEIVSRKHLVVYSEDDKFYVSDQGSRNGSFINDERLVPGQKVEFTSYFPVRLGDDVLISLITDDEISGNTEGKKIESFSPPLKSSLNEPVGKISPRSDSTEVVSLKALSSVSTQKLVLEKKIQKDKKAKKKQSKKNKINYSLYLIPVLVLVVAGWFHHQQKEEELALELINKQEIEIKKKKRKRIPPVVKEIVAEVKPEILDYEKILSAYEKESCLSDLEKQFCEFLDRDKNHIIKVIESDNFLNIFIDVRKSESDMKTYFDYENTKDTNPVTQEIFLQVKKIQPLFYLIKFYPLEKALPVGLKGSINFIFMDTQIEPHQIFSVFMATPKAFNDMKNFLMDSHLKYIKTNGTTSVSFIDNYFKFY